MRIFRTVKRMIIALLCVVLTFSVMYRDYNPYSMLVLKRKLFLERVEQRWVPLHAISPNMVKAVIVAEDARFCHHHGVDWGALRGAVQEAIADGDAPKGASTITMQVTRNLFLWQGRSYLRKILEIPFATIVDLVMSKRRIMEIYLNIAEWGDGIFGVEAAAIHYFKKSAGSLSEDEAAMLVSILPNPIERNPLKPTSYTRKYAGKINRRLDADVAYTGCLRYK